MKKTLLTSLIVLIAISANAQRYLTDDTFSDYDVELDVEYGSNITIQNFPFEDLPLYMDIYTPAGDTETNKPAVLLLHTGNFLDRFLPGNTIGLNGAATGAKNDSSLVYIARQLAKRGFFVGSVTYRSGWQPAAPVPETRTKTLLEAYYRGVQDTRTAIRFLRKDVAENGNTWGIDPDKIAVLGQGTGGYIMYGAAAVDSEAKLSLPEISDPATGLSYIDTGKLGDIFATNATEFCVPNHVGYDSAFQFGMNMGGACGTENWLDANTPPLAGVHVIKDPYAPYDCDGDVIVPTTGEFVIEVDGTNCIINAANNLGINDALLAANFDDPYTVASEQFDDTDNMFGLFTENAEAGPWDWWDMDFWDDIIPFSGPPDVNAGMLADNPDASVEKSMAYCDTIVNFFCPRAMVAMQIEGFEMFTMSGIDQLDPSLLTIAPNPSQGEVQIVWNADAIEIESVDLYNTSGARIAINYAGQSKLNLGNLPSGLYALHFNTSQGVLNKKLLIK